MAEKSILKVSDTNFESEVLKASEPVVVDFFADWCGPCKAMVPALEELSKELEGKIKVVKLNVDQNPETTSNYQIQAMPTLIIFKGGKIVLRHTGAIAQKAKLQAWVTEAL
ncbi:MAG: thioredoxin [Hyphomicrobiaceae bacterium]|nr:thioredoxin [Hyphomicrobiaceae bacterium]